MIASSPFIIIKLIGENKLTKVVVFGGSGFLGGYLVEQLASRDYEVVIADLVEPSEEFRKYKFVNCDNSH